MDELNPAEELEGLRRFLEALQSPGTTITRKGVDVTQREIDILKREIVHLENALVRAMSGSSDA